MNASARVYTDEMQGFYLEKAASKLGHRGSLSKLNKAAVCNRRDSG